MAQPSSRQGLIDYGLRQLGAPVLEINIDDDQIDDLLDDAIQVFNERHFDGVEEMFLKYKFTQADIDRGRTRGGSNTAVGIATTTAEVTIAGLERGLHVFCEKPPGRTVSDIRRVIACEKNHPGQKLKYGFNHRYHESVRDALELVEAGAMGRMINLRGVYGKSKLITFDQSDWRTKREIAGGGVLLDQGIHMADLMRLFAGEFHTVHSFVSNEFWNFDVEDNAYALMRSENRVVAMLHSSATQWQHRFRMEMTLEKGALILSGILSGSKSYGNETLTVVRLEDGPQGVPRENTTQYHEDPSWADEIAEFADCIVSDESVRNGSSEDALRTMELVYRIYDADPEWREKIGTF